MDSELKIAVVIPSYKVREQILSVISAIGAEVTKIYVVDDCCPDLSGDFVETNCRDKRVSVIRHSENQGVGGAVISGYKAALDEGMDIIVKIDGDGQMAPSLIPYFVSPIVAGSADYTKGNRFFDLESVRVMPSARLFGNVVLSFLTKISTGYWHLFDPTNGYTAIHRSVAENLPYDKISKRYFFESDMLFRLNTFRAVVVDIPMTAIYANEISNLKISSVLGEFVYKHIQNLCKRIFYNYYLRDMSLASFELIAGLFMFLFGGGFGVYHWFLSFATGHEATAGTVMLSALPVIVGLQLLLSFLGYDISTVPNQPISRIVSKRNITAKEK